MVVLGRACITLVLGCAIACGARTELDVPARSDAAPDGGGVDRSEASGPCDYGDIVADVFGSTVLWNGGVSVPPGWYRVTYVDGCMKYSAGQAWTVNAYSNGPDELFVVGDGSPVAMAPGTVGFVQGEGGYGTFDACVSANLAQDIPLEFNFAGGTLGLQLADDPYADNVAGENGRSPTYHLECVPEPVCDWQTPFDSVVPIAELSMPGAAELRLWRDETVGYFYRGGDIYVTQRASRGVPFGVPELAADLSSTSFDADPFVTADGLSVYLNSQRTGTLGDSDIFFATRPNTTAAFAPAVPVADVNSTVYDGTPYVTSDRSELWLASSRSGAIHLFRSRAQPGGFGPASPVDELNAQGAQDNNPVLTFDGLTVYFSSNRGGSTQIFVAHRATLSASFSPPSLVPEISTSGSDYASWISPDSCRLYMTRGTSAGYRLFLATRH